MFIFLRLLSCPFDSLIKYIPQKGSLLDIGTGYGLLPLLLKTRQVGQKIVAIDPDAERIAIAQKAVSTFKNLIFKVGSAESLKFSEKFDIVTIIDVLYLLPVEIKIHILKNIYPLLNKHGQLLIKINDRSFSLPYFLTWLQEILTVHIIKKTVTSHTGLYFESVNEIKDILTQYNFHVIKTVKLPTPFPFFHPHWLIIAEK